MVFGYLSAVIIVFILQSLVESDSDSDDDSGSDDETENEEQS